MPRGGHIALRRNATQDLFTAWGNCLRYKDQDIAKHCRGAAHNGICTAVTAPNLPSPSNHLANRSRHPTVAPSLLMHPWLKGSGHPGSAPSPSNDPFLFSVNTDPFQRNATNVLPWCWALRVVTAKVTAPRSLPCCWSGGSGIRGGMQGGIGEKRAVSVMCASFPHIVLQRRCFLFGLLNPVFQLPDPPTHCLPGCIRRWAVAGNGHTQRWRNRPGAHLIALGGKGETVDWPPCSHITVEIMGR